MKNIVLVVLLAIIAGLLWLIFSPEDYYEYDASSASECLAGEIFDDEAQVCYFDYYCETEAECADVDARIGDLLTALAEEYRTEQHNPTPHGSAPEGEVIELEDVGSTVRPSFSRAPRTVPEVIAALLPSPDAARIVKYQQYSDGADGILAYVEPVSPDGSTWALGFDPVDSYTDDGELKNPRQLMATLIHEYMHIASLNETQVKHVSQDADYIECEQGQIILNEGCALNSSYITQFVGQFWDQATRDAAYEALINGDEEDFSYELFDKNPTHFVTEYAATNSVEDLAESFAMFVMRDRNSNPSTVAERKTDFFYAFPKLVELRNHMRGGLARVLGDI